jgi:hypothetical protein
LSDYKELLRRVVLSLPVNSAAARRVAYERARTTFADQLRHLDPPLSARQITERRLQLEDCIRELEREIGRSSN